MGKFIDLTGQVFRRLTVLSGAGRSRYGQAMWLCRCECGKQKIINGSSMLNGLTMSCGCLRKKHGLAGTPIYSVWKNMRNRCNNQKALQYKNYGQRGISVCERWDKFENFYADMGDRPDELSIERIDNNGNYEPSNCKWATHKEQGRNQRTNRIIKYGGKSQCLAEWAEEIGIARDTLWRRLNEYPPQIALNM